MSLGRRQSGVLAACVAAVIASGAARASLGAEQASPVGFDAQRLFAEANADFRKGVELSAREPTRAMELGARAAAGYRELAVRGGVHNHRLELNLGNASLMAGDLGRAVAAFRRAEKLAPRDAGVKASLAAARARVGLRLEPDLRGKAWETALSWRGYVGRGTLLWVTLAGYAGAWAVAAWRVGAGQRRGGAAGVVMGLVALGSGGLLLADDWDRRASRDAVIVAPEVVGRSGPGEGLYEASFKQPLRAGVECRVLEERGDWARVRLIDGRETWVMLAGLERV